MVLIDGAIWPRYNTGNFYGKAHNDPDRGVSSGAGVVALFQRCRERGLNTLFEIAI